MTATCALPGCSKPARQINRAVYCSPEHAEAGKRAKRRARAALRKANEAPKPRGQPRAADASRQRPPERTYPLTINPRIVLRAPVPVVRHPAPLPFTDDLNAVLDHGSPGKPLTPEGRFV